MANETPDQYAERLQAREEAKGIHPGPLVELIQALTDAQDRRYYWGKLYDNTYEISLSGSNFKFQVVIEDEIYEQYFGENALTERGMGYENT